MKLRATAPLLLILSVVAACADEPGLAGALAEETVDGALPAKADNASTIAFREFDFYVPPVAALETAQNRMITTAAAFERVFGEEAPSSLQFEREWMVLASAGEQTESGVSVQVDEVRLAPSGRSLQVATTTVGAGEQCETSEYTYRPFKLVTFPKPSVAPQSVRYYVSNATTACATTTCEADALSLVTAVSEGLNHVSEGDASFEPMLLPGAAADAVDDVSTARLLGEPDGELLELADFDHWFDHRTHVDDPQDALLVRQAAAYQEIHDLFVARFTNLRVLRVGEIQVRVYLIGETSCGDLAVLKTVSIET